MGVTYVFKYFTMTIIGLSISILCTPIIGPILFAFFCYSTFVKLFLKLKYGKKVYRATGIDVIHGRETVYTLPALNTAMRVKGTLNFETVKKRLEGAVLSNKSKDGELRYKRMTETYEKEMGYCVWKSRETFDISQHVKLITLEELFPDNDMPVDEELEWAELMDRLLNKVGMNKFPKGLSPWNTYVIDERNGHFTTLFRFHHAISDGIFLIRMLCEDVLDEPHQMKSPYVPPTGIVKFITKLWLFCLIPFGIFELLLKNDQNPFHGVPLTGKKRFFTSKPIQLSKIKEIKSKAKTYLHAIMFSCVSFAVSSHFKRKEFSTKAITALSPVPLQNPREELKLKNKFGTTATTLPILPIDQNSKDVEQTKLIIEREKPVKNALNRLKAVEESLKETKENIAVLASNSVSRGLCKLLPQKWADALISVQGCTMCISNLPGISCESLLFSGSMIEHLFWVPDRDPMGAGIGILSYNDRIRAGFTIDEALIENDMEGKQFISDFANEFENLLEELQDVDYEDTSNTKILSSLP